MTLSDAIAAWKAENPPEWFPGEDYEAIAADRGQMWLERVQAEEAEAAWQQIITQFTNGMPTLENDLAIVQNAITNNTNLSQAQIKVGFRDLLQALIWLGRRIEDGTIPTRKP